MKKLFILILLTLSTAIPIIASENNLAADFTTYQTNTAFSGATMVSKISEDSIDVLLASDSLSFDGQEFDQDSIFNIGSVSKLFTTVSILQLQEKGLLSIDDPISLYIDGLTQDKQVITIKQLLTHTSGLCIDYNMEATQEDIVTKNDELTRINNYDLCYNPGEAYYYNNSGFTLASMIVENVSEMSFEDYVYQNIIQPLGMDNTGFPSSNLSKDKSIDGYIDNTDTGDVLDETYDWRNRGFTSVLSTTEDLNKFAYGIINNIIVDEQSVKYMTSLNDINPERGIGTNILTINNDTVIGHNGVWDYGNSALYYRPSDQILFVALTNELQLGYSYPAEDIRDAFFTNYPSFSLEQEPVISTITVKDQQNIPAQKNIDNELEVNSKTSKLKDTTKMVAAIGIVLIVLLIRIIIKQKNL